MRDDAHATKSDACKAQLAGQSQSRRANVSKGASSLIWPTNRGGGDSVHNVGRVWFGCSVILMVYRLCIGSEMHPVASSAHVACTSCRRPFVCQSSLHAHRPVDDRPLLNLAAIAIGPTRVPTVRTGGLQWPPTTGVSLMPALAQCVFAHTCSPRPGSTYMCIAVGYGAGFALGVGIAMQTCRLGNLHL